ncbi:MAG: flagellar basal body-associated FliL family protein [Pseudomonadota bacterium]
MANENQQDQEQAPKKSLAGLLTLVFAVLNIAVLAGGVYVVYKNTLGATHEITTEELAKRDLAAFEERLSEGPVMFDLDPFNTNLDGNPRRLVRIQMSLELLDAQGFEEAMQLGAQARDRVVQLLNRKTFDDIETVQGKLQLKNQIITQLNGFLDKGVVQNVYFSDFLIQ